MEAVNLIINGTRVSVARGMTVLEAAHRAGADIPTLYYMKGIVDTDESGVCVAEVNGALVNASLTRAEDGMTVVTNSPAVMAARAEALAKMLACHDFDCDHCPKTGTCELRELAHAYNVGGTPGLSKDALVPVEDASPCLVRDAAAAWRCAARCRASAP